MICQALFLLFNFKSAFKSKSTPKIEHKCRFTFLGKGQLFKGENSKKKLPVNRTLIL